MPLHLFTDYDDTIYKVWYSIDKGTPDTYDVQGTAAGYCIDKVVPEADDRVMECIEEEIKKEFEWEMGKYERYN